MINLLNYRHYCHNTCDLYIITRTLNQYETFFTFIQILISQLSQLTKTLYRSHYKSHRLETTYKTRPVELVIFV